VRDLRPRRGRPLLRRFSHVGQGPLPIRPAGQGERAIQSNEPVIIDLMWAQDGYLVDMARTYSVGPMPAKMEEAYGYAVAVLRAIEQESARGRGGDLYATGLPSRRPRRTRRISWARRV